MAERSNAAMARECLRMQGFDTPDAAMLPTPALAALWPRLLREEVAELEAGFADGDLVSVADALADVLYVAYQAAASCGLPIDDVFAEVHRSNLTKIPEEGHVTYREDGKVIKPAAYSPPDLAPIVARQARNSTSPARPDGD